jgi:hypothetical protein
VPDPQLNFWGNSILNRFSWTAVAAPALAVFFVLFAVFVLLDRPVVLGFYALATLALLGFFYTAYLGFTRHHGNLFLVFLAALWMAALPDPEPSRPGRLASIAAGARRLVPAVLGGLLAVQIAASAVAASYDIRYPFSQARRTAAFIRLQGLRDWVLVGDTHLKLAAVSAYLDRPFYYPYLEKWGAYSLFIHGVHDPMSMTPIVAAAERLSRETGRDYLIVLSYPLDEASIATRGLRPVAGFGSDIVGDEAFYLYRKERRESLLLRRAEDSGIMPRRGARP